MNPKPSSQPKPIRMGREMPASARKPKPKPGPSPEGEFRAKLYQQVLALLAMVEKLSLDCLRHKDRFGLDWQGLFQQVVASYKADGIQSLQAFQDMVMSKDGAHRLPKTLYPRFLDYRKACGEFMEWLRQADSPAAAGAETEKDPYLEPCDRFKQATLDLQQQICLFENERGAGEASFFS